ncbi:DUF922 domain-containing protein [Taklimakanibacter deserti]|uniref:DUF922 domain-containing protein n=1 Tax=Taklimakanibacter deserti TaxID=2267839 RepID=UPI000E65521C
MSNGSGGGTSYERYEVEGADLGDVAYDIFDPAAGKGTLSSDGQKRFAGETTLEFDHRSEWLFDPATQRITIQIKEVVWTTKVRLPQWRRAQFQAAPAAQRREYRRFLAALHRHELGHVYLYDFGMERVRAALVDTPAGRVAIPAAKAPEFKADGSPKTPEDKTIADAIDAAERRLVTEQADFREMEQKQDRYEAAPADPNADPDSVFAVEDPADQPNGTDNGRTQGAVLRP